MKRKYSYHQEKVCLYLVATPIGNLDDMTYRGVNILKMVDYIYAEDTRNSKVLLNHYNILTPLFSYHEHNEKLKTKEIIAHLKNNKNIAIISDAGMPLLSDPGYVVVKEAIENNISVTTIPGASAGISALVSSGLDTTSYLFYGFLDSKTIKRQKQLENLKTLEHTLIFYESPHRIKDSLADINKVLGNRYICIAKELTKKYEEYIRGNILDIINEVDVLKGEIVLIVKSYVKDIIGNDEALNYIEELINQGYKLKDATKKIASKYDLNKNTLYDLYVKKKN